MGSLRDQPDQTRAFAYAEDIRVRGAHNVGNVQAATLAAELIGIAPEVIHGRSANPRDCPTASEVVGMSTA